MINYAHLTTKSESGYTGKEASLGTTGMTYCPILSDMIPGEAVSNKSDRCVKGGGRNSILCWEKQRNIA